MKFRYSKKSFWVLVLSTFGMLSALVVLDFYKSRQPTSCYAQQIAAAQLMHLCIDSLRTIHFQKLNGYANKFDPNQTNLIGIEYSPITTSIGDLKAKRTSTNPDFAALIVLWFHKLKLKSGDVIAVGCSGSFPALIIATICAAEIMQLEPILITSPGASGYGANQPHFTYLDIESYLFQKGLIHHRSMAASLGGVGDIASDISPTGKQLLRQAIRRNNIQLIYLEDIEENVQLRARIYEMGGSPTTFINIGGAQINIGDYTSAKRLSPGLNYSHLRSARKIKSMIAYFSKKRIPIIHLLEIENIARHYKLTLDPIPLPELGCSPIYYDEYISPFVWIISIMLFLMSCLFLLLKKQ